MLKYSAFSVFLLLTFFFLSCVEEEEEVDERVTSNEDVFIRNFGAFEEFDYFPNEVGNSWTYRRVMRNSDEVDTLVVTVVGETTVSGDDFKIWDLSGTLRSERLLVMNRSDSVFFFPGDFDGDFFFEPNTQLYLTPFEKAVSWDGITTLDEYKVLSFQNLEIMNTTLNDAAAVWRAGFGQNAFLNDTTWFKPQLGIVKKKIFTRGFSSFRNESWELIDFRLQ